MTDIEYHSVVINDELVYPRKISLKHSISKIIVLSFVLINGIIGIWYKDLTDDIYAVYKNKNPIITWNMLILIIRIIFALTISIISIYVLYDYIFPNNRLVSIHNHNQLQSKAQCDNIIANMDNDDSNMPWYKKFTQRLKTYHRLDTVLIEYLNTVYEQYIKMIGNILQRLERIEDKLDAFMNSQKLYNESNTKQFAEQSKKMDEQFAELIRSIRRNT